VRGRFQTSPALLEELDRLIAFARDPGAPLALSMGIARLRDAANDVDFEDAAPLGVAVARLPSRLQSLVDLGVAWRSGDVSDAVLDAAIAQHRAVVAAVRGRLAPDAPQRQGLALLDEGLDSLFARAPEAARSLFAQAAESLIDRK